MKGVVYFIVVAIAAVHFVNAGHHHSGGNAEKKSTEVIAESERSRTCPHGFKPHGKHCIHIITLKPSVHCPNGFFRTTEHENHCVRFFDQSFECPPDSIRENGICLRTRQVEPFVHCPHGFKVLSDGRECARAVPLPDQFFCPHGSVPREDVCIIKVAVAPKFVCPPGFLLVEDRRCKIVETFDCTPPVHQHSKESVASHKHHKHLRLLGEHNEVSTVVSKERPTIEKEFVSERTCKRVRLEPARRICPEGSNHRGNECFIEEEIPLHERKGGFKEEIVHAAFVCPEGSIPSSPFGRFHCLIKEEAGVRHFCPHNTELVDHRCAKFSPLILHCPVDHKIEDGLCVKTIVAPAIVELNVALKCVGKDCGHHHHMGSPEHHKK